MSPDHICSNCNEPTNIQVFGDGKWEWLCQDCYSEMVPESEREPYYNHTPYEESRSYRESMIDAGRGHLLR